jgi:hypothetical protein
MAFGLMQSSKVWNECQYADATEKRKAPPTRGGAIKPKGGLLSVLCVGEYFSNPFCNRCYALFLP